MKHFVNAPMKIVYIHECMPIVHEYPITSGSLDNSSKGKIFRQELEDGASILYFMPDEDVISQQSLRGNNKK